MPVVVNPGQGFVELALDWPDTRNALGPQEARELRLLVEGFETADNRPRAIIFSSQVSAIFSSGGNLRVIAELAKAGPKAVEETIYAEFQGLFRALRESSAVILAAVDGAAIGLGCDLAFAADLAFYGQKAWLAQGWVHAGLIPATGGLHAVSSKAGSQAVWRMLAEDKVMPDAIDELGLGAVVEDARAAALAFAAKLGALPAAPLTAMRHLLQIRGHDEHLEKALEYQVGFLSAPAFQTRAAELMSGRPSGADAKP